MNPMMPPPMDAEGSCLWRIFGSLLACLILFIFLVPIFPKLQILFEFPFYLVFGWILFFGRVFPEIRADPAMLASVAGALAAAGFILHRSCRWLAKCLQRAWRFKHTAASLALLVALFAAAISGTGLGRHTGWLITNPTIESGGINNTTEVREIKQIQQIFLAVKIYAIDHDGRYPDNLEDVVREGIVDRWASLVLSPGDPGRFPEPPLYFGAGMREDASHRLIVLAAARPRSSGTRRLACTNDGSVSSYKEEDFQRMLAEQLQAPTQE